jgi:hypothetical protein
MLDIFSTNPWLVGVAEVGLVTLAAIVCISLCVCTRKVRLARYDFELKRDMLQRGLSAEEIRTVVEAGRKAALPARKTAPHPSDLQHSQP